MNKSDLVKISNDEAFELGIKIHNQGHSIEYNPYRNLEFINFFSFKTIVLIFFIIFSKSSFLGIKPVPIDQTGS